MNKNFLVDQSNGLNCEDGYYDLHNCYDFSGFDYDVFEKTFRLKFVRTSESIGQRKKLSIKVFGVDSLELSDLFVVHASSNLVELGYKSAGDRDHDWLIGEEKCLPEDHLFFRFDEDQFIRIHGHRAEVE